MRISHPEGREPRFRAVWVAVEEKTEGGAFARRGSSHVVVLLLWSTKYGRPSGVWRSSHPWGRGIASEPAVVGEVEAGGTEVFAGVVVVVVGDGTGAGCGRAGRAFWRRGWIQVVVRVV